MIGKILDNLRKTVPLVHCITNYVTVNDCANALLAIGGSPIMSDDIADVRDITSICNALNINIGTLNNKTIESMLEAGKIANCLGHPCILDPVGAGASKLRTETAKKLIDEVKFTVIRGNISEIKALALGTGAARGVDANAVDAVTENNIDSAIEFIREFSKKTGSIIVVTGAIDLIVDRNTAFTIYNGRPEMSKVCGTGCMLSAIMPAFLCVADSHITGALAAVCAMGLCGELAFSESDGNSTYKTKIIDELYKLNGETLEKRSKYEVQ